MLKKILFGNKVRAILNHTNKILKRLVTAPTKDLKDIYKITAENLVTLIVGVSEKVFTPENIEAAMKAFLEYYAKSETQKGVGVSFSKKF